MATPCALITSCSSIKSSELVKQILATDGLPPPTVVLESILAYPWHIETKYYTADVSLCTSDIRTIGDKSFADSVQAFVAVFDTTQQSSFDQVCLWLPYLKELNPPVQILVCHRCSEGDAVSRDFAINWCLDNNFELVELEPAVDEDESYEEDDFKETVGVQRVIEALSCHSWPNLIMKDRPSCGRAFLLEQLQCEIAHSHQANSTKYGNVVAASDEDDVVWSQFVSSDAHSSELEQHEVDGCKTVTGEASHSSQPSKTTEDMIDSIIGNEATSDSTAGDCMDQESFEKLFDQLRVMKAAAAGMSTDQRKKYAEKVTMQFWQALGGNLDEFEGLSSDSD